MDNLYSVYVIKSLTSGLLYVGMAQNVQNRLNEHNSGKSKFTSGHRPWVLVYSEEVGSTQEARKKEKYYKSTAGKNFLRKQGLLD